MQQVTQNKLRKKTFLTVARILPMSFTLNFLTKSARVTNLSGQQRVISIKTKTTG